MIILGIETSCDETSAAILEQKEDRIQILSNVVASSADLQSKYGGIIPEQAAREQLKSMVPVIEESLQTSGYKENDIDAIAVTYGPGLIGSLLVGVETAKVLARVWDKPLIPINHLIGHFYANWIEVEGSADKLSTPHFPCIGLLVSGGHTDLVLFRDHGEYDYLGGTRDDAAGECFDKCARLLDLPYPGGPEISKLAKSGNPNTFKLPIPMQGSKDLDFSYSGLKTAVANIVKSGQVTDNKKADLALSLENTIIETLTEKVIRAAQGHNVDQIIVAGGVAANQKLKEELRKTCDKLGIKLYIPPANLCTDNAAMIASAAFFESKRINPQDLQANPNLSLAY